MWFVGLNGGLAGCYGYRIDFFYLYRGVDEGQGGAAERLVFAENQGEVAANWGLRHGDGDQDFRLHVFLHVGTSDEAYAHVGGDEAFQ